MCFPACNDLWKTTREWKKASEMNERTFARYLNLCYPFPEIVADILEYRKPRNMSLKELMNLAEGNVDFEKQFVTWAKRQEVI